MPRVDPPREYEFAHEGYCNADRDQPVGCGGCSCRAGREIKRLRAALEPFADQYDLLERNGYLGSQFLIRKGDVWLGHASVQEPVLKAAFDLLHPKTEKA